MSRSEDSVGTTRSGSPTPGQAARISQQAEILHAEHHRGTFVPSLDSCADHDRAEYLELARKVAPTVQAQQVSAAARAEALDAALDRAQPTEMGTGVAFPGTGQEGRVPPAGQQKRIVSSLMAQHAPVPGSLDDYTPAGLVEVIADTVQHAQARLQRNADKENRRLVKPVMVRVVVEAFTEDK